MNSVKLAVSSAFALLSFTACAKPLYDLVPFPCASDGTCPGGLACIPGVGCAAPQLGAPCSEGATDCTAADPRAVCSAGVCSLPCANGRGCEPGSVCSSGGPAEGACVADCTNGQSCAAGFSCKDLWYFGTKGCVSPSTTPAACASFEVENQCTFCGDADVLPRVTCPSFVCPANAHCLEAACACDPGFTSVNCDGVSCSDLPGGCPAPNWWCRPDTSIGAGCSDAPLRVSGTCTCSDGARIELACGHTLSCEERCASGCDTVLQDCPTPAASKCSLTLDETSTWRTLCTAETGGLPEGAECTNGEAQILGDDDCAAGLFCVVYGVESAKRACRRFCRADADCAGGEKCYAIDPLIPADGACVPECMILNDDCPPGLSCQPFQDNDRATYFPFCRSIGASGVDEPCNNPLECALDTACYPFAARASGRVCKALCDETNPCVRGGTCTPLPGVPNGGGLCL